jgi:replicative DNA helicase
VLNGGFMGGKLYVLGAPPASGKSTICAWCGDYASMKGFKIVYASYEMNREQLFIASLARLGELNSAVIEGKRFLDSEYPAVDTLKSRLTNAIKKYQEEIAPNLIIIEADESYTPNRLKAIAKKVEADLLIVDYLQLLSSGDLKLDNAYQETLRVSKIATELKRLARSLQIPVIAISDINKESYLKAISGNDLDMGALRDSFKIAHSADVILLLQSGQITTGKGDIKTTKDQLTLLAEKYPDKANEINHIKYNYPLNYKTADTYSRISIVKNRGGKLGEPIFKYSRALHNFQPLDFEIKNNQIDSEI